MPPLCHDAPRLHLPPHLSAAPDKARRTINTWVSDETADKINNLLPKGSIGGSTEMVLVNAIHLELPWASAAVFSTYLTGDADFTTGAGATVSTSFMNQTSSLQYGDDGKAQTVALPLAGGQLAVVVTLPHGDLATYEADLTADSPALAVPAGNTDVQLSLPRFSFTSPSFSLGSALKAMGMPIAFVPGSADFEGLTADPAAAQGIYISDVIQKTMIAVQETGVEAAAATAVVLDGSSSSSSSTPPPPVPMNVNRPFLISIVDQPTGAVLFLGRVEDPTAVGGP